MKNLDIVCNSTAQKENRIYYIDYYHNEKTYIILNDYIDESGTHKEKEKIFEIYNENDELLSRSSKYNFKTEYEHFFGLLFNANESIESMFEKMKNKKYGKSFFEILNANDWKSERATIPIAEAIANKYTIKDIAKLLDISCQEVVNQFNQMAKKSGYKLFN